MANDRIFELLKSAIAPASVTTWESTPGLTRESIRRLAADTAPQIAVSPWQYDQLVREGLVPDPRKRKPIDGAGVRFENGSG